MSIIGILDSLRTNPPSQTARHAFENTLAHAVTDLTCKPGQLRHSLA